MILCATDFSFIESNRRMALLKESELLGLPTLYSSGQSAADQGNILNHYGKVPGKGSSTIPKGSRAVPPEALLYRKRYR